MKVSELRKALEGMPDDAEVRVQKTTASERLTMKEADRQMAAFRALVERWPQHRRDIAMAFLGGAIATADMFGVDVEGFLKELRSVEPDPGVLVPPKDKQS